MIPKRTLTATLEISTGSMIITNRPPAFTGEADALTVSVSVLDGGAAYTPVGNVLAKLYLYWPGTINMSEAVDLTISGSTLTGSLPDTLTAVPGCPLMVIQLTDADTQDLIVAAASPIQITNVLGERVISSRPATPSEIIYIGRAPYIDPTTGHWMQWSVDTSGYIDTGVSAAGRPATFTARATTLPAGSDATASMSGTAENPVLNLGIPRGDTGTMANRYATCSTAAGTAAKTATITTGTFTLETGATVYVKFTNSNTVASPTLNVNSTGAKPIMRYGTTAAGTSAASSWTAGAVVPFTYDGTNWIMQSAWDNNTTYSNAGLGQGYGTCTTAAATAAKVVALSSYALTTGGVVSVKFTNSVPASATMNINSKGAKAIFYKGAAITAGVIEAGDLATFIYDGTHYHLLSIDRWHDDLSDLSQQIDDLEAFLGNQIAGFHNSIYRGKNLGSSVTAEQWAQIGAGTFDDMFIGDYWVINGVTWRIAAFDYWVNANSLSKHHVVIVPDTNLATCQMNKTNTTSGAYYNSDFRTGNNSNTGRATAISAANGAFGSAHILTYKDYLHSAVVDGYPSGQEWADCTVELMSEEMVYGGHIFAPITYGSVLYHNYTTSKSQLPLFQHDHSRISNCTSLWLRNVAGSIDFARVYRDGNADAGNASSSLGVRPVFGIVQS